MLHQIVKKIAEDISNLDNGTLCDMALESWKDFSTMFHYLYSSDRYDSFLYGFKGRMANEIPLTLKYLSLKEDHQATIYQGRGRDTVFAKQKLDWSHLYRDLACINQGMLAQIEYNEYRIKWASPDYFGNMPLVDKVRFQSETMLKIRDKLQMEWDKINDDYLKLMLIPRHTLAVPSGETTEQQTQEN